MNKRRFVVLLSLCLLIGVVIVVALTLHRNHREEVTRIEVEEAELFRIAKSYFRLHYALGWTPEGLSEEGFEVFYRDEHLRRSWLRDNIYYRPLRNRQLNRNPFGVENTFTYLNLKIYELYTGNILPYEKIVEYLSEEFELDGSLRLYNNGKHPDIESFVNWSRGRREEQESFFTNVMELSSYYFSVHACDNFERRSVTMMSPQMLDALAKAVFDPTYELDLTSLYRQGY